jgi:hypothetical protein
MKIGFRMLPAIALAAALVLVPRPSLAGNCGNGVGGGVGNPNCPSAPASLSAPAPLIGAGLPGLAVGIGYGIYWLRRRRNVG